MVSHVLRIRNNFDLKMDHGKENKIWEGKGKKYILHIIKLFDCLIYYLIFTMLLIQIKIKKIDKSFKK